MNRQPLTFMRPVTRMLIAGCASIFALGVGLSAAQPRQIDSGLYAIWYRDKFDLLDVPYIIGGQIVVQWSDVEPERGRYDFSSIAQGLGKLSNLGKKTTIQINGNQKPSWLFTKVPHYPEKLSVQVRDQDGTLMYWHSTYRDAYTSMLKAFAAFLAESPDKAALIGIRLNFNAIGTEHFPVPKEAQDLTKWIVPPGVQPGPPWSAEQVAQYEKAVVDTFVDHLAPHAKVFVRNNVDPEIAGQYRSFFETGKLAWFHTSSEAEPRSRKLESQYQRFYDDCRSGKTAGYAEPWASAWGDHGKTDHRSCSPPQWNYWRILLDLHCGVSFLALYANDLGVAVTGSYHVNQNHYDEATDRRGYQREFEEAFRFAAKYVGFHASPETAPGAWVAFRENSVALALNVPLEQDRQLAVFNGDYDFLATRLPDQTEGVHNIGNENERQGAWARRLAPNGKVEVKVDARFAASFKGGKVRVTYLDQADQGNSPFQLIAGERQLTVTPNGTGRWQTAELLLPDGPLTAEPGGAHFRIVAGSTPVCLHMLEVSRN